MIWVVVKVSGKHKQITLGLVLVVLVDAYLLNIRGSSQICLDDIVCQLLAGLKSREIFTLYPVWVTLRLERRGLTPTHTRTRTPRPFAPGTSSFGSGCAHHCLICWKEVSLVRLLTVLWDSQFFDSIG
jgi:hypothetical protein